MRILILIGLLLICGCSNQDPSKIVESAFKENDVNVKNDYKNSLDTLRLVFESSLQNIKNTDSINELNKFYSILKKNLYYIDSLRTVVEKLDSSDTKDTQTARNIFIINGIADSIYCKTLFTYDLAESISLLNTHKNEIRKYRLNILEESKSQEIKEQLFGSNTLWGISMMLYGFEKN